MSLKVDARSSGIESAIVYAPFDVALAELRTSGYDMTSTAKNAQLRMLEGPNSNVSQNGNYVLERPVYRKGEKNMLTRMPISPELARAMTQAHRERREYILSSQELEQALEDSVIFPDKAIEIPTNRFGQNELAVFVFGGEREAKAYGEFLREAGIKEMLVLPVDKDYVNKQKQPFARQLWFGRLGGGSFLDGGRNLGDGCGDDRVRGVRQVVSAEGANAVQISTRQESELYSPSQIAEALRSLGFSGLEDSLARKLRGK